MARKKSKRTKAVPAVRLNPSSSSSSPSPETQISRAQTRSQSTYLNQATTLPIRTRLQATRPPAMAPKPDKRDIVAEFSNYFGNESVLANWQRLCRDLAIDADLSSVKKCRLALKGTWVNIYDLIDANESGRIVKHFASQKELSKYTIETRRIFPKTRAKQGGPVRALLAHIFN